MRFCRCPSVKYFYENDHSRLWLWSYETWQLGLRQPPLNRELETQIKQTHQLSKPSDSTRTSRSGQKTLYLYVHNYVFQVLQDTKEPTLPLAVCSFRACCVLTRPNMVSNTRTEGLSASLLTVHVPSPTARQSAVNYHTTSTHTSLRVDIILVPWIIYVNVFVSLFKSF